MADANDTNSMPGKKPNKAPAKSVSSVASGSDSAVTNTYTAKNPMAKADGFCAKAFASAS
jgi:hypothetical protein